MEITFKSMTLLGSTLLTGLSAGLFFAWTVSVIPGTLKIDDATYLKTMQSINRAILNPAFFLIFFGSGLLLIISNIQSFHVTSTRSWLLAASALCYLLGTIGVTIWGNVPLNNQLEGIQLHDFSASHLEAFRGFYETKWNHFHYLRTVFSVLSFVLVSMALFIEKPTINL